MSLNDRKHYFVSKKNFRLKRFPWYSELAILERFKWGKGLVFWMQLLTPDISAMINGEIYQDVSSWPYSPNNDFPRGNMRNSHEDPVQCFCHNRIFGLQWSKKRTAVHSSLHGNAASPKYIQASSVLTTIKKFLSIFSLLHRLKSIHPLWEKSSRSWFAHKKTFNHQEADTISGTTLLI